MNILFLNPPHLSGEIYMKEIGRCGRRAVVGELWPQIGLAYLAAIALKCGASAKIIDAMAENLSMTSLLEEINSFNPHLIIANTTTPTFENDSQVLQSIKKDFPKIIFSFTGTHVSALPEESLRKSCADFVFINEAEETLRELLEKFQKKNSEDVEIIKEDSIRKILLDVCKDINGFAYMKDNEFILNPPRSFVDNLDSLPFPARHLLPNNAYKMPFFENEPFTTIIPTRGCPWQCIFCRAGKVWGRRIRTRSPENVLGEIETLVKDFNIRNIAFMTDSFTLNRNWAIKFLEELLKKNLKISWVCNSRVDAVDLNMLELMKKTGCKLISYGIESGDQNILNDAKKNIKLDDCIKAIEMTRKAKIISMAYFIIGLPGETWDSINRSIEFAIKLNPDYVNFHVATPFPGTELYDIAMAKGWLVSNNWADYEEEGSSVLRTEALTDTDLMKAQKIAMRRFYFRPAKLLKEIFSIKSFDQFISRLKAGLKIFISLFKK